MEQLYCIMNFAGLQPKVLIENLTEADIKSIQKIVTEFNLAPSNLKNYGATLTLNGENYIVPELLDFYDGYVIPMVQTSKF